MIGNGMPNEYVQAMEEVRELDAFAAVVYSSHFELGVAGDVNGTGVGSVAQAESKAGGEEVLGTKEEVPLEPGTGSREVEAGEEDEGTGILGKATEVFENVWGRVARTTGSDP